MLQKYINKYGFNFVFKTVWLSTYVVGNLMSKKKAEKGLKTMSLRNGIKEMTLFLLKSSEKWLCYNKVERDLKTFYIWRMMSRRIGKFHVLYDEFKNTSEIDIALTIVLYDNKDIIKEPNWTTAIDHQNGLLEASNKIVDFLKTATQEEFRYFLKVSSSQRLSFPASIAGIFIYSRVRNSNSLIMTSIIVDHTKKMFNKVNPRKIDVSPEKLVLLYGYFYGADKFNEMFYKDNLASLSMLSRTHKVQESILKRRNPKLEPLLELLDEEGLLTQRPSCFSIDNPIDLLKETHVYKAGLL